MEEGFVGVDEGDGDGDDGDGCPCLPDRNGEDGGSLPLFPPSDPFQWLGFWTVFEAVTTLFV